MTSLRARRGDDLANRMLGFAADVLRLPQQLPTEPPARDLGRQLTRAATSVGANYAEAQGAGSRQDFVHKLRIANKEARESLYWLKLIATRWEELGEEAAVLAVEADELVAMLTVAVRTASGASGRRGGPSRR